MRAVPVISAYLLAMVDAPEPLDNPNRAPALDDQDTRQPRKPTQSLDGGNRSSRPVRRNPKTRRRALLADQDLPRARRINSRKWTISQTLAHSYRGPLALRVHRRGRLALGARTAKPHLC